MLTPYDSAHRSCLRRAVGLCTSPWPAQRQAKGAIEQFGAAGLVSRICEKVCDRVRTCRGSWLPIVVNTGDLRGGYEPES